MSRLRTDLDLIRAEVDLAAGDPDAVERLARELHHLRHLYTVVKARHRRLDALIAAALRCPPRPLPLPEAPEEPGTSRDLLQAARQSRQPVTA